MSWSTILQKVWSHDLDNIYFTTFIVNLKKLCWIVEISKKVKLVTLVEGDLKAVFSIATTPRCKRGCYSFSWIVPLTLDPYLIMLSVEQGSSKYHVFHLWYDLTWDWTLVSWAIGNYSAHKANINFLKSISFCTYFPGYFFKI